MGSPFFIPSIGSQFLLGAYAKARKEYIEYTCPEDFKPSITVVIPAKNEANRLPYALASLDHQTYELDKVVVIDDGSTDNTFGVAKLMKELTDLDIEIIRRREKSIGKTPSLKMAIKKCTTDKMFVLDADTIIDDNYIEKVRVPHFNDNVASSYGIVKPITRGYKKKFYKEKIEPLLSELNSDDDKKILFDNKENVILDNLRYYLYEWSVIKYREGLYSMDQYFLKDSQNRLFGTTLFPIGCGVLYDKEKLKNVFDRYELSLGDNLTTSEDIFVGFDFCNSGLINYQVQDAYMATTEPKITRLPKQLVLWGSSFIQSAYYFGDLSKSLIGKGSRKHIGLTILPQIIEKVTYPVALIIVSFTSYEWAVMTIGIEYGTYVAITYLSSPKKDRKGLVSSLVISQPIRLLSIPIDLYILCKFCVDVIKGNRNWRK